MSNGLNFTRPFSARYGCEDDYESPVPVPEEEPVTSTSTETTEEI